MGEANRSNGLQQELFGVLSQLDRLLEDPRSENIRRPIELEGILPSAQVTCSNLKREGHRLGLSLSFYELIAESLLFNFPKTKTREAATEQLGDEWKAFKVTVVAECDRRFGKRFPQFVTDVLNTRYILRSFERKKPETVLGLSKFIQRVARNKQVVGLEAKESSFVRQEIRGQRLDV